MSLSVEINSAASVAADEKPTVLSVQKLDISVRTEAGIMPLVQSLSFDLKRGETLAIAGEVGLESPLRRWRSWGCSRRPRFMLLVARLYLMAPI